MFKTGDTVIHPVHGICSVKSVGGNLSDTGSYAITLKPFKPLPGDLKILLPADKIKKAGIRYPVDRKKIPHVLEILQSMPEEITATDSENEYFKVKKKIQRGDIYQIAETVRDMNEEDDEVYVQQKNKLAEFARNRLVDEIAYSAEIPKNKARNLIREVLKKRKGGNYAWKK